MASKIKPQKAGNGNKKGDWLGKLLSLLVAVGLYFYYQSAIQAEVFFTLPLRISGAEGRIVQLHDAQAVTLHLAGRTQDLENLRSSDFETYVRLLPSQEGMQRLAVNYRLRNNNLQLSKSISVQLEPALVRLSVEKEEAKELPIEVSIQGYPATGFSLGAYRVYPDTVNITGPASVLQKLQAISTKPVDITGKSQFFQELVELEVPVLPGLEKSLSQSLELAFERAQVEIQIEARSETKTFSLTPYVTNLPNNLQLLNMLPNLVRLTLQGNSDTLQSIEEGQPRLTIELDAGDIFASGRYALPVVVSGLPAGVSLLSSTPNRVSLVVNER